MSLDLLKSQQILDGLLGGTSNINLSNLASIQDCFTNIEDRLMQVAQRKLVDKLMTNENVAQLAATANQAGQIVGNLIANYEAVKTRLDTLSFGDAILALQKLTGNDRIAAVDKIRQQYEGKITGLNDMLANVANLDICKMDNYKPDGQLIPGQSTIPNVPPSAFPPYSSPIQTGAAITLVADNYNDLMYLVKDIIQKDQTKLNEPGYQEMVTSWYTIVMSYHDKIRQSTDASKDEQFNTEFQASIQYELAKNTKWTSGQKTEYERVTREAGVQIKSGAEDIRRKFMKGSIIPGTLLLTGITVYGKPGEDFTSFLDIKRAQRPQHLVEKYKGMRGVDIPDGGFYTNSSGGRFKVGTLAYSETSTGAYGKQLTSDKSCASTRVPGGSVLQLRNPDGTPYNPTGNNPDGLVTVEDTGAAKLTYNKVDVFSLTPEKYKNMSSVQVFLVSTGSKTYAPQYKRAQSLYGGA